MKKKIAILVLHLGIGGVERVISSIANILCEKYEIEIISTYKLNEKPAFYLDERIQVKYLLEKEKPNREEFVQAVKTMNIVNIIKEGFKSINTLILKKTKMVKAIKNLDADIAISTRYIHNKWLGKYANKSIIKIAQEHNHHNDNKKYIKKVITSLKNIDYFMPTSMELTEFYKEKLKSTKTKTYFIQNSIDCYSNKVATLDSKNIISVGRLSKEKGFDDLIDIFEKVSVKCPEWSLKIVGDGVLYNELSMKIKEKNLGTKIELCGFKTREELDKLYLNSSIYVMTSHTESFGLVLVEAENYGLPIVVFDSAQGAHEIVENKRNGYFVQNRDKNEMAHKIIELIKNKDLRKKMGQEGKKMAKKYDKKIVSELWYKFIDSCEKQI